MRTHELRLDLDQQARDGTGYEAPEVAVMGAAERLTLGPSTSTVEDNPGGPHQGYKDTKPPSTPSPGGPS